MPVDTRISVVDKYAVDDRSDANGELPKKKHADFETAIAAAGCGKFQYLLFLTIIPVTWSTSLDTSNVSIILPSAECDLGITFFQKGLLNAATFVGMVSSGFLWGYVADVRGRRTVFIYGYLADGICNVLSGFSQDFWTLVFFKFLSGFIISGPHASTVTYCSEFYGISARTRIPLIIGFSISFGNTVTAALAWLVVPQSWSIVLGDGKFVYNSWRIFLSLCGVPILLGVVGLSFFPESPKFLMTQGRNAEALKVFQQIYRLNTGKPAAEYPIESLEEKSLRKQENDNMKSTKTAILSYGPRLCLITSMQFATMLAFNTIRLWQPQLFAILDRFDSTRHNRTMDGNPTFCEILDHSTIQKAADVEQLACRNIVSKSVYLNTIVISSVASLLLISASFVSQILSHRPMLFISYGAALSCIVYIIWSTNTVITLGLTCVFAGLTNIAMNVVVGVVVILFPTSLRTMAVSLVMTFGRIGSMIGNVLFPVLLAYGCIAPILTLSGFLLSCFLLTCLLPRSRKTDE
ncbi:putative transporter svop-1 [Augochlora pura]